MERLTWEEMVEKYPDKWVILDDVEIERNIDIISGVVIGVYDDDEIDEAFVGYLRAGKRQYRKKRTTEMHGLGVIAGGNISY